VPANGPDAAVPTRDQVVLATPRGALERRGERARGTFAVSRVEVDQVLDASEPQPGRRRRGPRNVEPPDEQPELGDARTDVLVLIDVDPRRGPFRCAEIVGIGPRRAQPVQAGDPQRPLPESLLPTCHTGHPARLNVAQRVTLTW
jgi:hypothetical protein